MNSNIHAINGACNIEQLVNGTLLRMKARAHRAASDLQWRLDRPRRDALDEDRASVGAFGICWPATSQT